MRLGLNNNEIQKMNRCLVLKLMLEKNSLTRKELSSATGLQKATITNIINEFLSVGIVSENEDGEGSKRGEKLRLSLQEMYILSISVSRKNYRVYLYTLDGIRKKAFEQAINMKEDILNIFSSMKKDIRLILDEIGKSNVIGACIGIPGPYIKQAQNVALVSDFEQLSRIDMRKELENEFHIPFLSEHDAKLSAFAEWKTLNMEEEDDKRNVSLVALRSTGIGIGAGIIIQGRIVEGQLGIAGEIGHMGINYNEKRKNIKHEGIWEQHAGTEAAVKYVKERLYEFPDSVLSENSGYREIVDAYLVNDPLAVCAMDKLAWMTGYGLASIIYILNPDYIILGRDYPETDKFIGKVRKAVSEFVHPLILEHVSVKSSEMKDDSIVRGGYYFVLDYLLKHNQLLDCIKRVKETADTAD